jgi:hypothetical protein
MSRVCNHLRGDRRECCQREPCSTSCSSANRTARSCSSRENVFVVLFVMAPPSQELEPPANPGRFTAPAKEALALQRPLPNGSLHDIQDSPRPYFGRLERVRDGTSEAGCYARRPSFANNKAFELPAVGSTTVFARARAEQLVASSHPSRQYRLVSWGSRHGS